MSDVNWDLAPEGAEELIQKGEFVGWAKSGCRWSHMGSDWIQYDSKGNDTVIATRPQERKTIQDVLEAYPEWPKSHEGEKWIGIGVTSHGTITPYQKGSDVDRNKKGCYPICTREEYEKTRGEEVSEWTHRTNAGELCKIHVDEPDVNGVIIVLNDRGEYLRHNSDSLKPIKTQITKAEAWNMLNETECTIHEFGNRLIELQNKYEIID